MKCWRNWTDTTCIHEAGHMTACELMYIPAIYSVDEKGNPCTALAIQDCNRGKDLALTLGADVAVAMSLGYPVMETCVAMYHHACKNAKEFNDWSHIRDIASEDDVMYMACRLERIFGMDGWRLCSHNTLLAHCRYDAFNYLPHALRLLRSGDTATILKVFGEREPSELIERLENPDTCLATADELKSKA